MNVYKHFEFRFMFILNKIIWFSLNFLILKTGKGNWCTIIKEINLNLNLNIGK